MARDYGRLRPHGIERLKRPTEQPSRPLATQGLFYDGRIRGPNKGGVKWSHPLAIPIMIGIAVLLPVWLAWVPVRRVQAWLRWIRT